MDTFIERQGFYDYINHFVVGAVLVIGMEIITGPFKFSFSKILRDEIITKFCDRGNKNLFFYNLCTIVIWGIIFFLLGIFVQELYSLIYEELLYKHTIKFLKKNKTKKVDRIKRFGSRLLFKVNKSVYIKNLFVDDFIINSSIKYKHYEKYAQKAIGKFDEEYSKEDMSSFFLPYCTYCVEEQEKNIKIEKLRDIEGLAMSLSLVFLMLMSISFAGCFYTVISDGKYLWFELGWCCIFAIFSMIFDWRAERTIKNRIRITLGIYEAIEERRKKKL